MKHARHKALFIVKCTEVTHSSFRELLSLKQTNNLNYERKQARQLKEKEQPARQIYSGIPRDEKKRSFFSFSLRQLLWLESLLTQHLK